MKENYEIKLISIGIIFLIVGTIIKLVEVGQSWPYIIMWMGWFMLSIGMVSLVVKIFQRDENKDEKRMPGHHGFKAKSS